MSTIEPQRYICYHCKVESYEYDNYSSPDAEYRIGFFRTDGKIINSPQSDSNIVKFCPHCEKFVIREKLKRGQKLAENERYAGLTKADITPRILEINHFSGSKIVQDAIDEFRKQRSPERLRWFSGIYSCEDILFALNSPELQGEKDIIYQLQLCYWRENNHTEFTDQNPTATSKIYLELMKTWDGYMDERYLFKAEMLRNMGRFNESNELLENPLPQYKEILRRYKNWAKVIRTLNELKHMKSFEVNI